MNTANTLRFTILSVVIALAAYGATENYSRYSRQKDLMRDGERLENLGKFRRAAKAYRKSGLYALDNRARAAALTREADCYLAAGKPYDAYTAYERLLESYPLFAPYADVMPKLRRLAGMFERGEGALFSFRNRGKATEVYELILQETPVGAGVMQDSINLGALLHEQGRDLEAVEIYREALRRFPGDPLAPNAHLALGRLLADQSKNGDGDGLLARQAVRELRTFQAARPEDSAAEDVDFLLKLIDERQADALCDLGEFYLRPAHQRRPAARRYLNAVLSRYGGAAASARAEVLLAAMGPEPEGGEPVVDVVGPGIPVAKPATPAAEGAKPKQDRPQRRLLDGLLPDGAADEGPTRSYRTLQERENVQKWLLPLDDVNELKSGGTQE